MVVSTADLAVFTRQDPHQADKLLKVQKELDEAKIILVIIAFLWLIIRYEQ